MRADVIAALYVQTDGVYYGLEDVDPWDEARDARTYAGPWPVVAHPPCARWCALAPLNHSQYGHRIGDDGGTFAAALAAVNRYGGVLEHPARTYAWAAFHLPVPGRYGWYQSLLDDSWTTEVSQSAYGHPTRKRTWLYFVGPEPPALDWSEPEAAAIVSDLGPGNSRRRGKDWQPGVQYAAASATPEAFRDVLLQLARSVSTQVDVTPYQREAPMSAKTKCADCGTRVNVHPWGTRIGSHWRYDWRCGPCQYVYEHPEAARLQPSRPVAHTQPSLDDALAEREDAPNGRMG